MPTKLSTFNFISNPPGIAAPLSDNNPATYADTDGGFNTRFNPTAPITVTHARLYARENPYGYWNFYKSDTQGNFTPAYNAYIEIKNLWVQVAPNLYCLTMPFDTPMTVGVYDEIGGENVANNYLIGSVGAYDNNTPPNTVPFRAYEVQLWNGVPPSPTVGMDTDSDTVKPTPSSASVGASGLQLSVVWSENVTGNTGLTLSGALHGAVTLSDVSTVGNTTTATLSRTLFSDETAIKLNYAPGNFADTASSPNGAEAFSNFTVTNGSTKTRVVISSYNPNPVDQLAELVVTGSGFNNLVAGNGHEQGLVMVGNNVVTFVDCDYVVDSDTQITVTTPTSSTHAGPNLRIRAIADIDGAGETQTADGPNTLTVSCPAGSHWDADLQSCEPNLAYDIPLPRVKNVWGGTGVESTSVKATAPSDVPVGITLRLEIKEESDAEWIDGSEPVSANGVAELVGERTRKEMYQARWVAITTDGEYAGDVVTFGLNGPTEAGEGLLQDATVINTLPIEYSNPIRFFSYEFDYIASQSTVVVPTQIDGDTPITSGYNPTLDIDGTGYQFCGGWFNEFPQPPLVAGETRYLAIGGLHRWNWGNSEYGSVYGPPTNIVLPALLSVPTPEIQTQINSTTATVAAVDFDESWTGLKFRYATTTDTQNIVTLDMVDGQPLVIANLDTTEYRGRFVAESEDSAGTSQYAYFMPSTSGPVPSAPSEMRVGPRNAAGTAVTVRMPELPTGATSLKIKGKLHGGGAYVDTNVSGVLGGADATITGLTVPEDYDFVAVAVNENGDSLNGPPLWVTTLAGGGGGDDDITAPSTPAAPVVTKNCAGSTLVIANPAWDVDADHPTASIFIERSADNGVTWSALHTFNAAGGTHSDATALPFVEYRYRATGINTAGASAASAVTTITLQSAATLAWLTPAETTLSGKQTLRVQVTDPNETSDSCGNVTGSGPCAESDLDFVLTLGGVPMGVVPVLESGTPRNGVYAVPWDTRDFADGLRDLRITVVGADCCRAKLDRSLTLNNSLEFAVTYEVIAITAALPEGKQYILAECAFQKEPLHANPLRHKWVRFAISTTAPTVDFKSLAITPADKAAAFAAMTPFSVELKHAGVTPEQEQYATPELVPLAPPGQAVYWVMQNTPVTNIAAYLTGDDKVRSIEAAVDGDVSGIVGVFSTGVGSAHFRLFDGTAFTEEYDLSTHGAIDAVAAALVGNKIIVARASEIFAIDRDAGQIDLPLTPRGETRPAIGVWNYAGKPLAIVAGSGKTRAYDLTFGAPLLLWELPVVATFARLHNGTLFVAANGAYYGSVSPVTLPVLSHTFTANVTAAMRGEDFLLVGLSNRQVWRKVDGGAWVQVSTVLGAGFCNAVDAGEWTPTGTPTEMVRAVAGGDSPALAEELPGGGWSDARIIEPPAAMPETVTQITALHRYERVITPASGVEGEEGFVPAVTEITLLIGTAPDGVLLSLSRTDGTGALKASAVSSLSLECPYATIPAVAA
jgi:hypothetical protein